MSQIQNREEGRSWKLGNGHGRVVEKYFVKFVGALLSNSAKSELLWEYLLKLDLY